MNERMERVLQKMEKKGIDQLLVSDPLSIRFLTGIMVHPGERLYALLLRTNGTHTMFLNYLYYVSDTGFEEVWFSDMDDQIGVLTEHIDTKGVIGIDKVFPARFLIKTDRDYPKCNPEFALMDPTYTYTVPTKQMVAGSFDILSHVMETYFSEPDEDNVSDDISEALMRGVITSLRAALVNPEDYTARSNLMWLSTMAENRIIKLGKKCDFECHQMEHQISAYTNCSHGCGLAVLHPVYYRHICQAGAKKFTRFAENVWKIPRNGRTDEEMAEAGVEALADFIREIGLPTTLREVGVEKKEDLKEIADSCYLVDGSYKKMTHEEILEIFLECF